MLNREIKRSVSLIKSSKHTTVFTGAGISVESGIPPFRGENGLWSKYNPQILELSYFYKNSIKSWKLIKEIFYDFIGKAKPNQAHYLLAEMEKKGLIDCIITQNIDNLHYEAGSKNIYEFHGNSRDLVCTNCGKKYKVSNKILQNLPPACKQCRGLLKPDFIFFGEQIPEKARIGSFAEAEIADLFILIGTTGEVIPASFIPQLAKRNGAAIIEINPNKSNYTDSIADIFLKGKATEIASYLEREI